MTAFRPVTFGLTIAALVLLADQASKIALLERFGLRERSPVEVTPFFNLVAVWNYGISFGMLARDSNANRLFLIAIAGVILLMLYVWLRRAGRKRTALAIGMVMGGAVGNIIDRFRLGAVFDFLDVHAYGYHWPAFNVADSAICIGVLLLCLESLLSHEKESA